MPPNEIIVFIILSSTTMTNQSRMSKSHVKGNSNITYQSKSILSLFRVHLSLKGAASGARQLSEVWNSQEPIPTTTGHTTYKEELEPEQQEAHENMEPTGAGPELQGLQEAQRQGMDDHFSENTVYKLLMILRKDHDLKRIKSSSQRSKRHLPRGWSWNSILMI